MFFGETPNCGAGLRSRGHAELCVAQQTRGRLGAQRVDPRVPRAGSLRYRSFSPVPPDLRRLMRAALYARTGPPHEVLQLVELPTPHPRAGEVRVKLSWSGVNPSDVKTRAGTRTRTLPFTSIVPHSDGSGVIDEVGADVPHARIGERVWVWNAAWGRPFGTAAEYVVLPADQAVPLPGRVDLAAGACLGIPALTAHHAVTVDGVYGDRKSVV